MEFRILGPLEVVDARGVVPLGGPKPRALLTALLLHANRPVSAERLAVALWGEDATCDAVKTVQVHVSRLRKALADREAVATTPVGYRLRVRPGELDAERFEDLVNDGRHALAAGQFDRAAESLRDALSLWRGPPLEDVAYEPFAQREIARLEEQRLAALEGRVEAELAAGRHGELLAELKHRAAASPLRERLAEQLMLALYRCGRQGEALEVFARTRETLLSELGLEPGPGLKALQRQILEQDPSLELRSRAGPNEVSIAGGAEGSEAVPLPSVLAVAAEGTFVGRTADLDALAAVYAQAAAGRRRVLLLHGEPGIGKTRLAAEFARRAHEQGAIVLYGRCDEEALLAQQPFVEALRHYLSTRPAQQLVARLRYVSGELRRIVPELADRVPDLPEPLVGDPDGARSRLFEAVGALLCEAAQSAPVVLVIDDLHWADKASILLLKYLARYPRQTRLMLLGLYRETDVEINDPLSAMLAVLGREHQVERRSLTPLNAAAVAELVTIHAGERASSELRDVVYEETEGNAFFVVEVVRHLAESGAISIAGDGSPPDAATGRLTVPENVKDVIRKRVACLGPEASRLLATASVLGREFEIDTLQRANVRAEDDLVEELEVAVRARIIEEVAGQAGRYTFCHALIRNTIYCGLTTTRRAMLHRRAGAALEEAHAADIDSYLAELAHHFAQAGLSGDLGKAIEYGRRAGEHAGEQSAYERAAALFRQTGELIDAMNPARYRRQRCDLVIAQGEAERQAGDPAYRRTLLVAARLAQELHDPHRLARAALANNRGMFSSGQGIDRERVSVLRAALDAYDAGDSPTRAALLALLALELTTDPDSRLRDALNEEAVAMARRVNDPRTLALVLRQRCVAQWTPVQTEAERQEMLREAADLAERLADPLLAGHTAYFGAQAAMNIGDLEESDRLLARLTAIAEQLAQPFLRWYDALARAKRCAISGPADEAERLAYVALDIGRRAGQPDCAMWFLGQILAARFLQGSLDRPDPYMPGVIKEPGTLPPISAEITPIPSLPLLFGAAMSLILCEVGRLDEARRHFTVLMSGGLRDLPSDYLGLLIPVYASVACTALGDVRSAERLHEIIEPESHRLVTTGASWFGSTSHYLGLLAATLGRYDEAAARFAAAEQIYTSLDAKPWLARLHVDRDARSARSRRT